MTGRRTSARRAALGALCLTGLGLVAAQAAGESVFVVAEASIAARAWSRYRDLLWLAGQAAALALPALLLFSKLGSRLRTRLDRLSGGRRLVTATLFAGVYAALAIAANLPVAAARQVLAEPFGLAAPNWEAWSMAQAQGAWPLLVGALLLGWAPYALFARCPRVWPLWAAGLMIVAAAIALTAQPSRHDLRPVTDPALRATIAGLAARAGAPDARFALRRAERDRPCGGATVLGLGATKVLVLDTGLLRHHPDREVAQTVAHELKHYVLNDDRQALYVAVATIVGGLAGLSIAAAFIIRRSAGRFGFDALADPASLPLLVLIVAVLALPWSAAFHAYGRRIEHEADRFALELTRDNVAQAAQMQRYLGCSRLKDPDVSWIQATFGRSHPSIRARVDFAREYRPWVTGRRQVYAHRFRRERPDA